MDFFKSSRLVQGGIDAIGSSTILNHPYGLKPEVGSRLTGNRLENPQVSLWQCRKPQTLL